MFRHFKYLKKDSKVWEVGFTCDAKKKEEKKKK